jgi:hypothetical protein
MREKAIALSCDLVFFVLLGVGFSHLTPRKSEYRRVGVETRAGDTVTCL